MTGLMVIGAGGRVGRHLIKALNPGSIGTHRTATEGFVRFDLAEDDLADVMARPEGVTHAVIVAGIVNPEAIVADPERARRINIEGTIRLIDRLERWGITPVFTSSDAVLGLGRGPFTEMAPKKPLTLYGQMKQVVEDDLAGREGDWLVLRLSRVYGMDAEDGTLITSLLQRLLGGGTVAVAHDQLFAPIYIGDVVSAIKAAAERRLTGLYHLGGPQVVTHFAVANSLMREVRQRRPLEVTLEPRTINSFVGYEKRPTDIAMDSTRIRHELGLNFMNVDTAVRLIVDQTLR